MVSPSPTPDLDALNVACLWWDGWMDVDYGHATAVDVIRVVRQHPWAACHLAVLERSTPDGGDPTLLLLLDTIAGNNP